jgi:hypothetical protein
MIGEWRMEIGNWKVVNLSTKQNLALNSKIKNIYNLKSPISTLQLIKQVLTNKYTTQLAGLRSANLVPSPSILKIPH